MIFLYIELSDSVSISAYIIWVKWLDFIFVIIQAREFLSKLGDLSQTQIFAKIETVEVSHV